MKKLISALAALALLGAMLAIPASAATEYAKSISSMEIMEDGKTPTGMVQWPGCKMPVKIETNQQHKFDGKNSLKIYCTDNTALNGGDWHSMIYWDFNEMGGSAGDWTGAQYLEFWIKNDTGFNMGLQIQFTENDKNNLPNGEPWRSKVVTEVLYEDNGKFVKQTSDVTDPAQYNEFGNRTEGAIAIPKGFTGRIRIAINSNNFRRAEWFAAKPGDGSNQMIDKDNIGQISFGWDPRTIPDNGAWYLDSVRLVAPNANLKDGVPYDDLTKSFNGGSTVSTPTPSKPNPVSSTPSKQESKPNPTSSAAAVSSEASTPDTSAVSSEPAGDASSTESLTSSQAESTTGANTSETEKGGLSAGAIVAIVIACIVVVGGGVGIFLVLNKEKIFKKK